MKVVIASLNVEEEAAVFFIPLKCYEELLKEVIPPQIIDALLLNLKVVGTLDVDPQVTGVAYMNVGPYEDKGILIEITEGLYFPIEGITPIQCILNEEGKFIGCRYGTQKIILKGDCNLHEVGKTGLGPKYVIGLCKEVIDAIRNYYVGNKKVVAFAKVGSNLILWDVK